jgi:hypothetical protein
MARSILAAVQQIKSDVSQFLSQELIREVCAAADHVWRERILDPATTVHLFILQSYTATRRVRMCHDWEESVVVVRLIAMPVSACP